LLLHSITFSEANAKGLCKGVKTVQKLCRSTKKKFSNEIVARWFLHKTFFLLGLTKKHGFAKVVDTF
jgi:hypothetical protein